MNFFKKQLPVLPDETRFDLENRLFEPCFMRVPIGAALTSDLIGELPANPVAALKAVLGWAWFYWFGPRGTNPLPCLECGRVLLTWLADTPRLNDLVRPIIKEMSLGECNVIGGEPSIQNQLSPGIGFCTKKQIGKIDMGNWRREYRQCYGAWCRQIWDWLCDHHLSFWLFPYLVYSLAIHSVYIYGFYRFLERVKPSLILTDSEHNHPWNCLILVARQLKIPTLQMMHGVIYTSYGYYPLLSDAALCWGEQQRSQMMSFGVQPERLLITGCQRLRRENRCDGKNVRQRLGLPSELPVVMLATNPMPREEWRKLVFTFGDAFRGNDDFVAVVKLHPSERRNSYREEMVRYPEMSLFESAEWSVEESMAACDVVVSHNSGLGNDALVLRRPVVLLDVLKESLSNGRGLAERAGCPVVGSAIELRQIVTQIMTDQDYRQVLREHAEKYVTWFCYAYGQEAARNVVDAVRRRTTK